MDSSECWFKNPIASLRSGAASRAGRSRKRLRSREGFTLIESLVALAILGVIVAVLVHVHLQSLRAEAFSRLRGGAILQAETILTGAMLGKEPQAIRDEAQKAGWRVTAEPVDAPGAPVFTEWRVADSNPSAPSVSMMLRVVTTGGTPSPASALIKGK